jgi:hypothetical protein
MSCSDSSHLLGGFAGLRAARGLLVSFGVMALLVALCAQARAERPAVVDHSTEMYFPPIGQQMWGDCTCFSSCYYYSTYTQARDEGLYTKDSDPNVICSPAFLFGLIAQGWWGAVCTEHAMARLSDVGCATMAQHPYPTIPWSGDPTLWPTEAAWIGALNNRTGTFYKIRADNDEGLETIRQHIADGGCAVTRAYFYGNYWDYDYCGDTQTPNGPGISNYVMYSHGGTGPLFPHSICIAGYDDNRSYVDSRDGSRQEGAFLIANSEGQDWGWYNTGDPNDPNDLYTTRGYIWVAYAMFRNGEMGWYDPPPEEWDDVDPCVDNPPYPEVYYHDDRPHYRPTLYGVAGINHNARNLLTFSGGVGPTDEPEFTGPEAIEQTAQGAISINDSKRVAVDLTDGAGLIPPGTTKNVFVSLAVADVPTPPATITSVDFYHDFDGDGVYTNVPAEMESPLIVWRNTTGYVSVSVTNPLLGDLDGDGDVDLADLAQLLGSYGMIEGATYEDGDLDGDGDVDLVDLAALLGNYGCGT